MLRKSFVLVFIRYQLLARCHDQRFITAAACGRTDPLIWFPPQKLFIKFFLSKVFGGPGTFFLKGVGDPNPFTVRQMSFFRAPSQKRLFF